MVSQIMSILEEIPLGRYKVEIGLILRKVMLLGCMLFNSEVWHCINEKNIRDLEKVDEYLLRRLLSAHPKTPIEMLYLETGAIPIKFIISLRRLLYLHTILKRSDSELTKRVYFAQKESPVKGDFSQLVAEDVKLIGKTEQEITQISKKAFKKVATITIKNEALKHLRNRQQTHSKVNKIQYVKLQTQSYLTSPLFSDHEAKVIFKLRTEFLNCKMNFKFMHPKGDLKCPLCNTHNDTQQHILECEIIRNKVKSSEMLNADIKYEDIYSENIHKMKAIIVVFLNCLNIRDNLVENLFRIQDLSTPRSAGG